MTVAHSETFGIAAPRHVALLLSVFVAALGASVLAGWALDITFLKSILPVGVTMKSNTAMIMLLNGVALALLSLGSVGNGARLFAAVAACVGIALGTLTLGESFFGLDFGIDQWLFREAPGAAESTSPGRMSPSAAFCSVLMGIALVLASRPFAAQLRIPVLSALSITVILVGGLGLLGHLSLALFNIRFWNYAGLAVHTAAGLLVLGCALLAWVRSEGGLTWSLDAMTTGGFVVGIVSIVAAAGISYSFTDELRQDAREVARSQEVLKEIQELNTSQRDLTLSLGRYLITRDESSVAERARIKAAIQEDTDHIRRLTAGNPRQQIRLDQLEQLTVQRVAMSDQIIERVRRQASSAGTPSGGPSSTSRGESPLGNEYPKVGQSIDSILQEMEAEEYRLLQYRLNLSDASSTRTFLLMPVGVFLSLAMLSLGLFFLNESALARSRADVRLAKKRERLSVLHEIDRAIIAKKTPAEIADAGLPRLRDLLGLPRIAAILFDLEKNEVEWLAAVGRHRSRVGPGIRYPMELMGDLEGLKRGEAQLIDVHALSQRREVEALLASDVRWYMVVPMIVGEELIGGLSFGGPSREFSAEQIEIAGEVAAQLAIAIAQSRLSGRLEYLAYYDALTGLPNRSLFHDRLSHSLNSRGGDARLVAVVLLDLERFRRVNETLGRKSGDELLKEAGGRLQRANDTAARVGADVYGLVLRGARTAAEVNRALEAIVAACFTEPFAPAGEELRVTCRAGVALHPDDGADADTLLRNAEAALRRSKGEGERIVFYAPEMNARVAEALVIETKLRRAIERREFVLHYQPKVTLATRRIAGLEALIRWQDPDKGLVPPGKFISVLEETGMIVEVGRWAVEQTFVDLRAWAAGGIQVPRVAVNVSAVQLRGRDFVDSMVDEIARGGETPERLELEITESLVMHNVEDSTRKLSILRGMGVTVAIDDFGTGYSSLSYLGRLPVDSLKIDRSFVSGMTGGGEAAAIVSTVIALAHGLKLKVVAEGVETREQGEMLHQLGCDQAQGFYYGRPVPAGEIERLLRAGGALPAV